MLWTKLARQNQNPSTPKKMAFGILAMALAFALMIVAARVEDQTTEVQSTLRTLPAGVAVNDAGQFSEETQDGKPGKPYHAGRLHFDLSAAIFKMTGVLADLERDRMIADSAPVDFKEAVRQLKEKSLSIKKGDDGTTAATSVSVTLSTVPPDFDLINAGASASHFKFDPDKKTLSTDIPLSDKDAQGLLVSGGNTALQQSIWRLYNQSIRYRVSASWLVWFYILSTVGELCLSPIGLSMVSKLAPAKFAMMLMGMWLLTSFFGNFAAGAFGEKWGTMSPTDYFLIPVVALGAAALILFLFSRKISALMHGVD